MRGIPRGPAGQAVDIRFTYDLNGVLEVEATVVATNAKANLVITQYAQKLSSQQIAQAVAEMAALKHHPREDTVNRFLLKRAERIYQELPRDARDLLSQYLDGFEGAMDQQEDPAAIERWRQLLTEFLNNYESESDAEGSL